MLRGEYGKVIRLDSSARALNQNQVIKSQVIIRQLTRACESSPNFHGDPYVSPRFRGRRFLHGHRIEIVMWALIAEMLVSPFADSHPHAGAVLGLIGLATLLLAATTVRSTKIIRYAVYPAASLWIIARLLEAFGDSSRVYTQLAPVGGLLLSVSILVAIFEHFNSVPEVPRSAFAEAFICYLIMSIAYSQLYWILNRFLDKPFNVTIPHNETATLLYFSMMTISGVGYGGLLPINPYVRIIASLETMTGIFFVAVVVARLVASYQPASRSQPEHQSTKDAHLTKV